MCKEMIHIKSETHLLCGLDITKFIMAICVIAIHTNPFIQSNNAIVLKIFDCFTSIAVPFFFIASGYLLQMKIWHAAPSEETDIIILQLKRMLKLYLVWSAVYFPLAVAEYAKGEYSLLKAVLIYIKDFVFVGQHYNSWMLWYLLSTIYALIAILFLRKAKIKTERILVIALVIFIISILIDAIKMTDNTNSIIMLLKTFFKYTIGNGRLLRGFLYISLGMFFWNKRLSIKRYAFILAFTCLFIIYTIIEDELVGTIFLAPCVASFFLLITEVNIYSERCIILRKLSTEMYFLHLWIWTIYYTLMYGEKTYGWDCFLATFIFSVIASGIIVALRMKRSGFDSYQNI